MENTNIGGAIMAEEINKIIKQGMFSTFYILSNHKGRMLMYPPGFPFLADIGVFPLNQLVGYQCHGYSSNI